MKAMILAAGFGTRLFPLTIDRTKPAIPFLGKPVVGYVAEYIAGFGIKDVVVNVHHQPRSVMNALGDGSRFGVNIHYSIEEPNILGTAGALDNARDLLGDDTFIVINGKIITDIDLRAAVKAHKESGAVATMVLRPNPLGERFTVVETKDGCVTGFRELGPSDDAKSQAPLMFTGIQVLEPRVFDWIPRGEYSDIIPVFYRPAFEKGERVNAFVTDARWYELSTLRRYLDISLAMSPNGRVICGEGCTIAGDASLEDGVLWDRVSIEGGARVSRSVIGDGVTIASGEKIENAVVVRADLVDPNEDTPDKAQKGYFQGDKYIVPIA